MGDRVSNQTLSDLITGRRRVDPWTGAARAALGQGLGMGWGDEAEAQVESLKYGIPYEEALQRIRQEYAQYSKEYPISSTALEFAGGIAPAIGMMFVPGAQGAAATQAQRSTLGALGRLAALGGATGAVSGAGSAEEGQRGSGAVSGATIGTILGVGTPVAMRGTTGAMQWLKSRLPTESVAKQQAEKMLYDAVVNRSKMTPQQMEATLAADRAAGVPSTIANISPATARLTRGVAKTGSEGSDLIENVLSGQKFGGRERVHQQVVKGLNPKDYYDELSSLQADLRTKAAPFYQSAYAAGEVTDPAVLGFLTRPQFKQGLKEAQHLLEAEGRDVDMSRPTVEMLDQVKRGIDTLIERETDAITGKMTNKGRVYTAEKNKFLDALDTAVPDYAKARIIYKGDAELVDAMRKGLNNFGSMDPEQVTKLVTGMSDAEKQAFRTGVARKLYDTIMVPSGDVNVAQRLIGSPEAQLKLQPLFESPAQFNLFKNAMEREAQLFKHSSRILGGSDTAENLAIRESLAGSNNLTDFLDRAIAGGGFKAGLSGLALNAISWGKMTDKTASRLAEMLMAKDPHEVAAVVKFLEQHAASEAPRAVKATAAERGAVMGGATTVWPAPSVEQATPEPTDIEADISAQPTPGIPSIEADIEAAQQPK